MSAKPPRPTTLDAPTPPLPPPSDETTSTSPTSSSSATPGSMTPRARARYDARRESLLAELDSHDRATESRDLDWRLRKEVFASRLRKEDERFERIRRKRVAESVREMKARARELEKMEMEVETARSVRLASSPTSRPGSVMDFSSLGLPPPASTGGTRPQSTMLAGSAKADAARPHSFAPSRSPARSTSRHSMLDSPQKDSDQATQELFAFQDERRAKKLARQAAEDARKRAEAALREELERKLEAEFHEGDDEDEAEETRGRQIERVDRLTAVVVEPDAVKDVGIRQSWSPSSADAGGRSSADARSLSPAAAQASGRADAMPAGYSRYSWQSRTGRRDGDFPRDRSLSPLLAVSSARTMEPAGRVRTHAVTEGKNYQQHARQSTDGLPGVEALRPHQTDRVAKDSFHAVIPPSNPSQLLNVPAAEPVTGAPAKPVPEKDQSNTSSDIERPNLLSDFTVKQVSSKPEKIDLTQDLIPYPAGTLDGRDKVDVTADNVTPMPPPESGVLEIAVSETNVANPAELPAKRQRSKNIPAATDSECAPLQLEDAIVASSEQAYLAVNMSTGTSTSELQQSDDSVAQNGGQLKTEVPTAISELGPLQAEIPTLNPLRTEASRAESKLGPQRVPDDKFHPKLESGYQSAAFRQSQEIQPSLAKTDPEEAKLPAAAPEIESVRGSTGISVYATEETLPAGTETVLAARPTDNSEQLQPLAELSNLQPDTHVLAVGELDGVRSANNGESAQPPAELSDLQPDAHVLAVGEFDGVRSPNNGEFAQPPAELSNLQPDSDDLLMQAPPQSQSEEGALLSSDQEAEVPESSTSPDEADAAVSAKSSEQPSQVQGVQAKNATPSPLPEGNDPALEWCVRHHDSDLDTVSNVPSSEDILASRDERPTFSSKEPALLHTAATTANSDEVGQDELQPDVPVKTEAERESGQNDESHASLSLDPLLAVIASLSGTFESDEPASEDVSASNQAMQLFRTEDEFSQPAEMTTALRSPDAGRADADPDMPITEEEGTSGAINESSASLLLDPLLAVIASLGETLDSTTRAEEDGSGTSSHDGVEAGSEDSDHVALDRTTAEIAPSVTFNEQQSTVTDISDNREALTTHPTEPEPVISVSNEDRTEHDESVDTFNALSPVFGGESDKDTQPQRANPLLSGPLRIKVPRRRPPSSGHLRQIHSSRFQHASTPSETPTTAVDAEPSSTPDNASSEPAVKKVGRKISAVPPILLTTLHTYGSPPTGLTTVSLLASPTVFTPSTALAPSSTASRVGAPSPSALANSPRLKKASPFPNCSPQANLILFKGRRRVHATRVAATEWTSMNKSDAYVLIAPTLDADGAVQGAKVYVWAGAEAGKVKKSKAREFAGRVIEREWGRKAAELVILESDFEPTTESIAFWRLLGVDSGLEPPDLKPTGDDDVEHEKMVEQRTQLYGINDDNTALVVLSPSGKALTHKVFQPQKCFVLDCIDEIFVWIGRGTGESEKDLVKAFAEKLSRNPNRTPIQVMYERDGAERVLFRERFVDWPADAGTGGVMEVRSPTNVEAKDKTRGVYVRGSDEPKATHLNIADMYNGKSKLVASSPTLHAMPATLADRISLQVWICQRSDTGGAPLGIVPATEHGIFYSRETYLALNRFRAKGEGSASGREAAIGYIWLGAESKSTERAAAALLATTLEKQHAARLVRVEEGKEPADFVSMFTGGAIVRRGSRTTSPSEKAMFHFHRSGTGPVRCAETIWSANALSSLDSFVLLTKGQIFIWHGTQSPPNTRAAARQACTNLSSQSPAEVVEGAEPKALQRALDLSSRKTRQSNPGIAPAVSRALRLFRVSHVSGGPTAEEIDPFMAADLSPGNVYILDAGTDVFLWVGAEARRDRHADVKLGLETVLAYTTFANQQGRALPPALVVMAGSEPQAFRAAFCAWDAYVPATDEDGDETGSSQPSTFLSKLKRLGKKRSQSEPETAEATLEKFTTHTHSLEALSQRDSLPFGVDPAHVEAHLSPEDFILLFTVPLTTFRALPAWKQAELKRKVGLF
ncbi:hypothetical protein HDU89_008750 [Geranomyces variabilis]|nr:hypothetical protein HDU89_008750 [Geranomyces variabilis]